MKLQDQINNLAKLAVREGVNLKKGQNLYIVGSVECYPFIRKIVKEAYAVGAAQVKVFYNDMENVKQNYLHQSVESLCDIPKWMIDARLEVVDKKGCYLNVFSDDPEALKGCDPRKIGQVQAKTRNLLKKLHQASMTNNIRWSIVAHSTPGWAKKVFPKDTEEKAVEKLWKLILKASYVDKTDLKDWQDHTKKIQERCKKLNAMDIKTLIYKSSNGTDFTFDLPKGYVFLGGKEKDVNGVAFSANIPTEEVFTSPDFRTGNGKLVCSKPLSFNGILMDGIWFEFKNGRVVKYGAKKGLDALKQIVEMDEGSHYLGEASFVEYDSPISNFNVLFYNTLFDENAACHFALGKGYATLNERVSNKELYKRGINDSAIHVDFMIGTRDLSIKAITRKGKEVQIFKNGNFAF